MFEVKRLSEISLEEAVEIWNLGFEGYFTEIKMTVEAFTTRLVTEEMSPTLSIIGYQDGEPVGIILSGIRENNGKKVAWNGGTGVPVKFRGQGFGRKMMEVALDIYKEEGVELATLEAMGQNENAIKLYEKVGFDIIDRLAFLQKAGKLSENAFNTDKEYQLEKGIALDARQLSILDNHVPWQTQWQSLRKDGELAIVKDGEEEIAYFLYKRGIGQDGKLASIVLYHAGAVANREDMEDAIRFGLRNILEPEIECTRATFNFPNKNQEVIKVLKEAGFESKLEQVFMEKNIDLV